MSPLSGDSDEEYTKCHQCGLWDGMHHTGCINSLRDDYVAGRIELEEFEERIGEAIETAPAKWLDPGKPVRM